MIKLSGAFFRRVDITPAECLEHYRNHHGPLVMTSERFASNVDRYYQHDRIEWGTTLSNAEDAICGVSQLWYSSLTQLRDAFMTAVYQEEIRPDEHRFISLSQSVVIIGSETVVINEEIDAPIRVFRFIKYHGARQDNYREYARAYSRRLIDMEGRTAAPKLFTQTLALESTEGQIGDVLHSYDVLDEFGFTSLLKAKDFLSLDAEIQAFARQHQTVEGMEVVQLATNYRRVIGSRPLQII